MKILIDVGDIRKTEIGKTTNFKSFYGVIQYAKKKKYSIFKRTKDELIILTKDNLVLHYYKEQKIRGKKNE